MVYIPKNIKKNMVDANKLIYRLICKSAEHGLTSDEFDMLVSNSRYISNEIYKFKA